MVLELLPPTLRAATPAGRHSAMGRAGRSGIPLRPDTGRGGAGRNRPSCSGAPPTPQSLDPGRPGHPDQAPHHLAAAGDHCGADVHHPGRTSIGIAGPLGGAGGLPHGGRRKRDQHVVRPGHRRQDESHPAAPHPGRQNPRHAWLGLRDRARAPGLCRLLVPGEPLERVAGAGRSPLLRLHLYHLAQAIESAEHRDRRGSWGIPAAGGLGSRDRSPRSSRHLSLRHHFLLDSPAFLGARFDQARRIRQGGSPDDARGQGRGANQVRDARVYPDAVAAYAHAGVLRGLGRFLWGCGGPARGTAALVLHPPATGAVGNPSRLANVPLLPPVSGASLRRHGCRSGPPVWPWQPAPVLILDQPEQDLATPTGGHHAH